MKNCSRPSLKRGRGVSSPTLGSVMRLSFTLCLAALFVSTATGQAPKYPQTKRVDHIDDYHGVKVPDPYRWLEADVRESREVSEWVAGQNKVTFAYLNTIPEREAIKKRLT